MGSPALAVQSAEVLRKTVPVFKKPSQRSAQINILSKGDNVPVSTNRVKDPTGMYWHKVKLPTGGTGYIQSVQIRTAKEARSLKQARVLASNDESGAVLQAQAPDRLPWSFVLRVMGVGATDWVRGYQFLGEGELSSCIPFAIHGYGHRMFSLGAFYLPFNTDTAVGASGIFRIFTSTRVEPEIRVRFGSGLVSGGYLAGVNFGVNYPFSLNFESYLAGYLEAGSLFALDGSSRWLWASAGIGIHF